MPNNVLYFPYIQVPKSTWFTRVLLYWDKVGAIIPSEYIKKPKSLGEYTHSLIESGLLFQVFPGNYIQYIPNFNESFMQYIESLGQDLTNRQEFFNINIRTLIHDEKMSNVSRKLIKLGLAEKKSFPWFEVETNTAFDFMTYLAAVLGKQEDLQSTPITDQTIFLSEFIKSSNKDLTIEHKINPLRQIVLNDLLPAPKHPLSASEIQKFKNKHGDKLIRFRRYIETELTRIATISDTDLLERSLDLFREMTNSEILEITEKMRDFKWNDIIFGKLCAVIGNIPGIPGVLGLASAVYNAFGNNLDRTKTSPLLYAAYAQRKLLHNQVIQHPSFDNH